MKIKIILLLTLLMPSICTYAQRNKGRKAKTEVKKDKPEEKPEGIMTERAKTVFRDMLPNTQQVFIIDSTLTRTDDALKAIPLPKSYGEFIHYDTFFGTETGNDSYVFLNGFGNRCYYTEMGADSITRLFMRDRLGDGWGEAKPLEEINERFSSVCFPYMASDGQTLYFSGVSSEDGLGKRDIYMSKYNAEEDRFFAPENIGLPFNSSADDWLYVVADADHLAWFVSSRRQKGDTTCVYTFVPSDTRSNYDADEMEEIELRRLASITSIRATWTDDMQLEQSLARLQGLRASAKKRESATDEIYFIVNDELTYTDISQFRSTDTRQEYYEIVRMDTELRSVERKLYALRTKYHNAGSKERESLGRQISMLEQEREEKTLMLRKSEAALRAKESRLSGSSPKL